MKKYLALVTILGVAACGGGGGTASPPQQSAGAQPSGAPQQPRTPVTSGLLAAIDGHTLQVQSSTAQTAVTWSATTSFSDTVPASAAAVNVGSCVTVRDSTVRPTSTPAPSATRPTTITAVSVSVSAPVNGACTGGFGGGGGGRGTPPSGFVRPSGAPGGAGGGGRGGFGGGGAFGKVVSKSSSGFVVQGSAPGQTTSAITTTVTSTATTTYTTQQKATSTALKVGECVSARGQSDSSGTVAASSIAISAATNGTCTTGFGAGRG
ncbi:MAG: hypothetical protein JWL79_1799 [Frankiales bacterium]|nr:hypothetical protein [Frankiales bacterium]